MNHPLGPMRKVLTCTGAYNGTTHREYTSLNLECGHVKHQPATVPVPKKSHCPACGRVGPRPAAYVAPWPGLER